MSIGIDGEVNEGLCRLRSTNHDGVRSWLEVGFFPQGNFAQMNSAPNSAPRADRSRLELCPATLHMVCGKIAAGKSTFTHGLADKPRTIRISEDQWLSRLYPNEIKELPDYVRYSERLRQAMGDHVRTLLQAKLSVVLDFPANTPATRKWAKSIADGAGAWHLLHWLDVPDSICKERLRLRNEAGEHPYATTDAQFEEITRRFVPPEGEGLQVLRYPPRAQASSPSYPASLTTAPQTS